MTQVFLIRHGETDWNVIGKYQGQADPPLNENGITQSEKLSNQLHKANLDLLISSPLKRAAQTAQILTAKFDVPIIFDERLVEIHQGMWQEKLRYEIKEKYPELFLRWETHPWEVTPPGGENLSQVQMRVYTAINEYVCNFPNRRLGIVTHRIPIALIKLKYQDFEKDIVRTLHLPNTYCEELTISCQEEDFLE